jgi:hypothetical protein
MRGSNHRCMRAVSMRTQPALHYAPKGGAVCETVSLVAMMLHAQEKWFFFKAPSFFKHAQTHAQENIKKIMIMMYI